MKAFELMKKQGFSRFFCGWGGGGPPFALPQTGKASPFNTIFVFKNGELAVSLKSMLPASGFQYFKNVIPVAGNQAKIIISYLKFLF